MWTDLGFNLILLLASDYFAVLMMSNVCYFIFNFLNLQSGWIHRIDRKDWARPYRCPTWLLATGAVFGFVNMIWMGAGADVWGEGTLRNGLLAALLIIPVFAYRHYVQDKGKFPVSEGTAEDPFEKELVVPRAGWLPYAALIACAALVWAAHNWAQLPG
jgi:amino acid transporter